MCGVRPAGAGDASIVRRRRDKLCHARLAFVAELAAELAERSYGVCSPRPVIGLRREVGQRRRPRLKSRMISRAALCPGKPVTPPPGCAPEPHRYSPASGMR